jgi:hypothetical protein
MPSLHPLRRGYYCRELSEGSFERWFIQTSHTPLIVDLRVVITSCFVAVGLAEGPLGGCKQTLAGFVLTTVSR